jgi:hypothetical protein
MCPVYKSTYERRDELKSDAVPRKEFIRETLDWLDKYRGPVKS